MRAHTQLTATVEAILLVKMTAHAPVPTTCSGRLWPSPSTVPALSAQPLWSRTRRVYVWHEGSLVSLRLYQTSDFPAVTIHASPLPAPLPVPVLCVSSRGVRNLVTGLGRPGSVGGTKTELCTLEQGVPTQVL